MQRRFIALFVACSLAVALPRVGVVRAQSSSPDRLREEIRTLHRELDEFQQQLDQTRTRRRKTREKLRETEQRENSLLGVIERYNRQIQRARERLQNLEDREREAREKLRAVTRDLKRTRSKLSSHKEDLAGRLRSLYMEGQGGRSQLILGAQSVTDLMTRMRYYREVLRRDRRILEEYRASRDELRALKEKRRETLQRHRALRRQVASALDRKSRLVEKRREVLRTIRNRQSLYDRRLRELESQKQKLHRTVVELQQRRTRTRRKLERIQGEFGQRKGSLPWPVENHTILRPFGTWRRDRSGPVLENDGIDIGVQQGAPVRSVASGTVMFARRYTGMGNVVILRHGGGYLSLYGSLVETSVQEGDEVEEGQRLGRAGRTSGLEEPRLYFQLFHGKSVLNPTRWLR